MDVEILKIRAYQNNLLQSNALVVTNFVSFKFGQSASSFDDFCTCIRFGRKRAVAARTLFAVVVVIRSTTVSAIPIATSIIVVVITRFVTLPGWGVSTCVCVQPQLVTQHGKPYFLYLLRLG